MNKILSETVAVFLILSILLIFLSFLYKSALLLRSFEGIHGINYGMSEMVSNLKVGDRVVLNDSAWVGVEKFQKSHYVAFMTHNQGATMLMPSIEKDHLRGGYHRNNIGDTLKNTKKVNWLIDSKGVYVKKSVFKIAPSVPVFENENYRLFRLNEEPVAVAGAGWYDCEPQHCWTDSPFDLEVFIPDDQMNYEIQIFLNFFSAPVDSKVYINIKGKPTISESTQVTQINIPIDAGWSQIKLEANWKLKSPASIRLNTDERMLFAMVRSVNIISFKNHNYKDGK